MCRVPLLRPTRPDYRKLVTIDNTGGDEPKSNYPYTSFRTLLNLLDRFQREGGVPTRLDRGVLLGMAEGAKTQLIAALRFLGLINAAGESLPEFGGLAMNESERPQLVAALLRRHYSKQVALGAKPSTQKQLEESFEGIDGDTRRKAVAFFLHAAKYGQVQTSPYFKTPRVGMAAAAVGRKRKPRTPAPPPPSEMPQQSAEDANRQKYLDLLMKRLEESKGGQLDGALLDRIEGLLGYQKGDEKES